MTPDVVVMGGTFDPVHVGHISVLEQVLDRTGAPRGLLVPARVPPLRPMPAAGDAQRLAMLQAALAGHPRLQLSDLELRREGPSYTADTLQLLRAQEPATEFALLLGADAARSIARWHRAADLLAAGSFLIVDRSGEVPLDDAELWALGFPPSRTRHLVVDSPPVSATGVRTRVAAGQPIDALVPAGVRDIILREHLYRTALPVHNGGG